MTPRNYRLLRQLRDLQNIPDMPVRVAIAQKVAETAQGLAPVDTGELKGSIHEKDGDIVADAPHAIHVEFGTVNMDAQPFLRPAVDLHYKEIVEAAAEIRNAQMREAIK